MSKLIIIHHSPVIRKGLIAMSKTVNGFDVSEYSTIPSADSIGVSDQPTLVFCEICDNNNWSSEALKHVNLIGIGNSDKNIGNEYQDVISEEVQENIFCAKLEDFKASIDDVSDDKEDELSTREKDVLKLVAFGHTNKEIADKLFISVHTVVTHRKHITEKLGIKSISGLTVYAILNKIIDTSEINVEDLI